MDRIISEIMWPSLCMSEVLFTCLPNSSHSRYSSSSPPQTDLASVCGLLDLTTELAGNIKLWHFFYLLDVNFNIFLKYFPDTTQTWLRDIHGSYQLL